MPIRKYLKTPTNVDGFVLEEWKNNGEKEGIDFFDYHIHAIGVENFNPNDWNSGEPLFTNPADVDLEALKNDDSLWFEYEDGHTTLSHVLEGNIKGVGNKQKVGGAHVAQFLEFLGLEVVPVTIYSNGVFEATLKKNGIPKTSPDHTMYPIHWEWPIVIDHFYGALLNSKYLTGNTFVGEYQLPGEQKVTIHIGFSTSDRSFRITTFYPVKP